MVGLYNIFEIFVIRLINEIGELWKIFINIFGFIYKILFYLM